MSEHRYTDGLRLAQDLDYCIVNDRDELLWLPLGQTVRDTIQKFWRATMIGFDVVGGGGGEEDALDNHLRMFGRRTHSAAELPVRVCEWLGRSDVFTIIASSECRISALVEVIMLARSFYRSCGFGGVSAIVRGGDGELFKFFDDQRIPYLRAPVSEICEGLEIRLGVGVVDGCPPLSVAQVVTDCPDCTYADGVNRVGAVVLHGNVVVDVDRFLLCMLTMCDGRLPLALAPVQVLILDLTGDGCFAHDAASQLVGAGYRCELRKVSERLAAEVAVGAAARVPLIAVVGGKEATAGELALRWRGSSEVSPASPERMLELLQRHAEVELKKSRV